MRAESDVQTPAQGGAARKAVSVLMALVLALGLCPIPKQAYAANSVTAASIGTMELADTYLATINMGGSKPSTAGAGDTFRPTVNSVYATNNGTAGAQGGKLTLAVWGKMGDGAETMLSSEPVDVSSTYAYNSMASYGSSYGPEYYFKVSNSSAYGQVAATAPTTTGAYTVWIRAIWTPDGETDSLTVDSDPWTLNVVEKHDITVGTVENGTITVKGSSSSSAEEISSAKQGDTIYVFAEGTGDYQATSVTAAVESGDDIQATKSSYGNYWEFTMPDADVTVNATFGAAYAINKPNASDVPGLSAILVRSNDQNVEKAAEGAEIIVKPAAQSYYTIDSVTVTGADGTVIDLEDTTYYGGAAWKFTMPAQTVTIAVKVKAQTWELGAQANEGGTVKFKTGEDADGNPIWSDKFEQTNDNGTTPIVVKIEPNEGNSFDAPTIVNANGSSVQSYIAKIEADASDDTGTLYKVTYSSYGTSYWQTPLYVKVNFLTSSAITASATEHGSYTVMVNEEAATSAYSGDTVVVKTTPDETYELEAITVTTASGKSVEVGKDGAFTMPDEAVTIDVTFRVAPTRYSITGTTDNTEEKQAVKSLSFTAQGEYDATNSAEVAAEGSAITVHPVFNTGYALDAVSVVGADGNAVELSQNTAGAYTFTMPASNVTVSVTSKVLSYNLEINDSEGGTVTIASVNGVENATTFEYPFDDAVTLKLNVQPDEGYKLSAGSYWSPSISLKDSSGYDTDEYWDVSVNVAEDGLSATVTIEASYYDYEEDTLYISASFTEGDAQTITASEPSELTYGDEAFDLNASVEEQEDANLVITSSDENVVAYNAETGKAEIKGAGVATVTITAPAIVNYAETSKAITFDVAEKANDMTAVAAKSVVTPAFSHSEKTLSAENFYKIENASNDGANLMFAKKYGDSRITVDPETGDITLPAEMPLGSYLMKVAVVDTGSQNLLPVIHSVTFTIKVVPFDVSMSYLVLEKTSSPYNGQAQPVSVKSADGVELKDGDYEVSYKIKDDSGNWTRWNDVDAPLQVGEYRVYITGKGNFTGTTYDSSYSTYAATFEITKGDLSDAEVTLSSDKFTYNGKAQAPTVTSVKVDGIEVAEDDYAVAYSNQQSANAGSYDVTVTGQGNYEGTAKATYTIAKASSSISLKAYNAAYTGSALAYKGTVTKSGSTGKVTYAYYSDSACTKTVKAADVKAAGTYYVKATLAEDDNYLKATSAAAKMTITAKANPVTVASKAAKKANPLTIKVGKTGAGAAVTKAQGTVTVANKSTNAVAKKLKLAYKSGKVNVTVPKGTKTGVYEVKIAVTANSDSKNKNYTKVTKTVSCWVKVS